MCKFNIIVNKEQIFIRCKWILGHDGQLVPFTGKDLDRLVREVIEPMASDGLRTIGLAYKDYISKAANKTDESQVVYDGDVDWDNEDAVVGDLTLIAIMGIQDPVRPGCSHLFTYIK